MTHEIFWAGQWMVTTRIGQILIAIALCDGYGQALYVFCQLSGVA